MFRGDHHRGVCVSVTAGAGSLKKSHSWLCVMHMLGACCKGTGCTLTNAPSRLGRGPEACLSGGCRWLFAPSARTAAARGGARNRTSRRRAGRHGRSISLIGLQREMSITAGAVLARSAWVAVGEPSALKTVTRSYEYFPAHTRARDTGTNVREQG